MYDFQIVKISCYRSHVLALDAIGNLFVWGKNSHGALSIKKECSALVPRKLNLQVKGVLKILCAEDCSAFLTHSGEVYVSGRNTSNRFGFGTKTKYTDFFKKVSCIKKEVIDFSIAVNHSAYVLAGGYLLTIGDNKNGQHGIGHTKQLNSPTLLKTLTPKYIKVKIDF